MRLREEIHSSLILSALDQHTKNHELIIVELLLDIRDQNEEIKNQLIIMNNGLNIKDFKTTSIDISVDKICDKADYTL